VRQAQEYVQEGYDWVVDIDLEKFFDRVNHDMLMARSPAVNKALDNTYWRSQGLVRIVGRYRRLRFT
jgi:retron-type reverse transcriptase